MPGLDSGSDVFSGVVYEIPDSDDDSKVPGLVLEPDSPRHKSYIIEDGWLWCVLGMSTHQRKLYERKFFGLGVISLNCVLKHPTPTFCRRWNSNV